MTADRHSHAEAACPARAYLFKLGHPQVRRLRGGGGPPTAWWRREFEETLIPPVQLAEDGKGLVRAGTRAQTASGRERAKERGSVDA